MKKRKWIALLVIFALAACASPVPPPTSIPSTPAPTIQPSPTPEPPTLAPTFDPACGVSGLLEQGNSLSVETDLGEHPGWIRYIDPHAKFTFVFPTGWDIYQKDNVICLGSFSNPGQKLVIAFKTAGSNQIIQQPPLTTAEPTFGGQILFLNQRIDKEWVKSGDQLMTVLYNSGEEIAAAGITFSMSYGNWRSGGDENPLSDEDRMNADLILQSFSQLEVTNWVYPSLDRSLTAALTRARPVEASDLHQVYQRLDVVNGDGAILYTPVEGWQEQALGMTNYQPVRWSADNRFFYFTQVVWGDGCVVIPVNGSTLSRLDTTTGEVRELFGGWAFYIALSPDETQLAYITDGVQALVFRDLSTFEERRVVIDPGWDFQAGYLSWSTDGKFVALTLANLPCQTEETGVEPFSKSTSTLLVNVDTLEVRTLISEDPDHRIVLGWTSPWRIELQNSQGDKSYIDIKE